MRTAIPLWMAYFNYDGVNIDGNIIVNVLGDMTHLASGPWDYFRKIGSYGELLKEWQVWEAAGKVPKLNGVIAVRVQGDLISTWPAFCLASDSSDACETNGECDEGATFPDGVSLSVCGEVRVENSGFCAGSSSSPTVGGGVARAVVREYCPPSAPPP